LILLQAVQDAHLKNMGGGGPMLIRSSMD
jgi:hypothetical protein